MSAIREVIAIAQTVGCREEVDAAEAELKDLAAAVARPLRDEIKRLRLQFIDRDRRDAELREAFEAFRSSRRKRRLDARCKIYDVLERWARGGAA